jgi:hypothetical protein
MDPAEAERDAVSSLLRAPYAGGSPLQPPGYSDDPRPGYSEDSLSDEGGQVANYHDGDDLNDGPFASSSPSREPPESIWGSSMNLHGTTEDSSLRGGYSDDPRLEHSEEGGRVADCFDDGGGLGGGSVGIVGTRAPHRLGGVVAAARQKRGIVPAVCLLLALAFGCRIIFVTFWGEGSGGGVAVVEGNSASDSTEAGGGGWSDGYDYAVLDDDIIGGDAGGDHEEEEEEEEVIEETILETIVEREPEENPNKNPTEAPNRNIEMAMVWWSHHWCGTCTWNDFTSCEARKGFLMHHYGITELEAMEGTREYCAIATQAPSVSSQPSQAPSVSSQPSSMPTENPTEAAMVWWSHHWCGNCRWNNFTSCDARKGYLMHRYGKTELEAMEGTREYCAIATQAPSVSSQPSSMPSQDRSSQPSGL